MNPPCRRTATENTKSIPLRHISAVYHLAPDNQIDMSSVVGGTRGPTINRGDQSRLDILRPDAHPDGEEGNIELVFL
jgi:hypothetical protein